MNQLLYTINDSIPTRKLLCFSLQMMLSVFVATILIANICGVSVSGALFGAGLSTLVYLVITKKQSPMFVSNSGAFVAPVMIALSAGGYTAVAVGGLVTCIVYCIFGFIFSKVPVEKIYKIFPKSLIGAITIVIGVNLMPFILSYVQVEGANNNWGLFIAFLTMFVIALCSHYGKGVLRVIPFLIGTIIGYLVAVVLTVSGVASLVDFSVFENISFVTMPDFAFLHWKTIPLQTLMPIIVIYIAFTISAMMEALSDHAALSGIIGVDLYKNPGLNKIFYGEGLANLVGSSFGGLGICSYGEGVACIGFSKVASVSVTGLAALFLIVLSILDPIQAFIASIPSCVFAGSAIILYGFITCSGIKILQHINLNQQKTLIIVSVVLSLGISGLIIGNETFSLTATALALVTGIILNLFLKEEI